jgi:peptide/nickel transport system substrate-binding protein
MSSTFSSIKKQIPSREEGKRLFRSFSTKEWVLFCALLIAILGSVISILISINNTFLTDVPKHGGSVSEGIVGTPRFVNPVLAISDSDRDLTMLVYSGLMRKNPDGILISDLAEKYSLSENGLEYTFTLKKDLEFQDKTPITANDVAFTIAKIKDPIIKSPKKANWDGVTTEVVDAQTIKFTLKQKYAGFLENTTVGILPEHLWKDLTPEEFGLSKQNINGIGSGPFLIKNISESNDGIPQYYELKTFKKFALGEPYLKTLFIKFYAGEKELIDALKNGSVDAINEITPSEAQKLENSRYEITTTPLPRVFGLYFNQTEAPIFTDKNVRKAISLVIDRKAIIDNILSGYGTEINSPFPPRLLNREEISEGDKPHFDQDLAQAETLLKASGWNKNSLGIWEKKDKKQTKTLAFSIATSDTPELKNTAMMIKDSLVAFGISTEVKVFEIGTLNQSIIRPRKYDALFFGQIVNHETDLYAFWHSSQRNDRFLYII